MAVANLGSTQLNQVTVFLGYVDEKISEKYSNSVDFSTSKIGGLPDWINGQPSGATCGLCSNVLKLVCQIYAPVKNSAHHRTLYIMACLQPVCWNQLEGWKCFRGQKIDSWSVQSQASNNPVEETLTSNHMTSSDWLDGADDWGSDSEQTNDDNGNFQTNLDHCQMSINKMSFEPNIKHQMSSSSDDPSPTYDDPNANQLVSQESSGAMGGTDYSGLVASAEVEIETDQELVDLVLAESPKTLEEFLSENPSSIPELLFTNPKISPNSSPTVKLIAPYFLAVEEENSDNVDSSNLSLTEHEKQLLQEYTLKEGLPEERKHQPKGSGSTDLYEKSIPRHGDVWFHKFKTVTQKNPGQVVRYVRDLGHSPLFLSKPEYRMIPQCCVYCRGPVVCEVQLLPSLIPSLKFDCEADETDVIEFGSVFVYTCYKSCWEDCDTTTSKSAYRVEQIYLQAETW